VVHTPVPESGPHSAQYTLGVNPWLPYGQARAGGGYCRRLDCSVQPPQPPSAAHITTLSAPSSTPGGSWPASSPHPLLVAVDGPRRACHGSDPTRLKKRPEHAQLTGYGCCLF